MKNIVNRALVAKKKQFQSKSVPRGTRTIWRYLGALFLLFTFAIGNVWGADPTHESPSIVEKANRTFLNLAGTPSNVTVSTDSYSNYGPGYFISNKNADLSASWWSFTGTFKSSSSSYSNVSGAVGFHAVGSSSSSEFYQILQLREGSGRMVQMDFYVTGTTQIGFQWKNANTSGSKYLEFAIYEMNVSGTTATDGASPVSTIQGSTTSDANQYEASAALNGAKYYHVVVTPHNTSNINFYGLTFKHAPVDTYSVTYSPGDGSVKEGKSLPTQAAVPAGTEITLASADDLELDGKEFDGWLCSKNSTKYAAGAKYTMTADATTFTAQWRNPLPKYTVTYDLNGASGDAPTETDKAAGDAFNLAAAPSWAGHAFDGWLCNIDSEVKAAGSSYTMTTANTTFTAQWHEVDCKIYSFTGGIGSAIKESSDKASVDADKLVLSGSAGVIKLVPAAGETFKAGDVITISGMVGNTAEAFGVKISASNAKGDDLGTASVAGTTIPLIASVALTGNADNLYISRKGGTTTTIYTCEVHRSCAEGVAAGLVYETTEVAKTEGDAAFTNPLTNANGLVIAGYKSSNTAVATVATNGQVTVVGQGSATITAYSAVQTKAGTLYAAGTATYALTVAALPKYHVTYDLNGGSGEVAEVDHKAGEKFTLHDGVTGVTAPGSKTFVNWKDQDDALFDGGVEYTMPAKDVTLTAQWAGDVYTVKFMDGETVLDTKVVEVGSHPTDIEHPTKPLYTFAAWQLSGSDVILDDVSGAKDAVVTLTARWAKIYATSYDMEAYAASAGADKDGLEGELTSAGYAFTNVNGIDNGHTHNYIYDGMKYKTNDGDLSFNVNAGKLVIVKTGNLPANALTMYINGVADPTVFVGANEAVETHVNNYFYSEAEALYRLDIQASKGTCAIKAVTITDPFEVSYDADGGDPVAAQYGEPYVTLPLPVKGTESFLGWFDGETKVGMNGDKYTPTTNITLTAHWEAVSTDARLASISFSSDAGTLSPAFDPEVTSYTYTMPYGTAAIPTITGATSVNAKAQDPIIGDAATAWGEAQTIQGVAQSGDKKTYTITMVKAPKDGVCIIKATINSTTKNSIGEVTGLYKKDASCGGLSGYKFNGKGAYIGIELVAGQTFNEGDVINVHTTTAAEQGTIALYNDHGNTVAAFHDYGVMGGAGDNKFALPASAEEKSLIYVCRTEANTWNGFVDYIEVTRAMNPLLTAIQFNSTDVEVTSTTVAALLPQGTNLGTMTVTPTIYWNGAGTAEVTSNEGAWAWGANTYRVTDKDGDYTEYTITLTEDELKHTVSFNTHGGSAIDPVQVVDGQKLAAAPADPTKEDYLFQGWSETDGGSIVDVTTITISADKEFHAVWASDGAIKLLNGATVNHTNFITGVTADETVEFMGNEVHYAKFSGTVSGVNGVKDLTRVIAYNATTNKTKIRIYAHNNSTSGRNILVKGLVEGADAATDLATIALGNKEDKISDWIEFNNAANRTIYIMVSSSAGDVYFTQVKVIESGETPMKQAGEAGYALNLNKGRFFGLASTDLAFEGLNARLSGDYTALNSGYAKLNATSMSFTVASDMNLVVTTNNSKTYYVTKGAAGTENETAKTGVSEFDLTAGTWYITAGNSEVQFTNIAFALPKCEQPTIETQPATKQTFGPGNLTATVVVDAPSDGGTLKYQWYKAADDSEVSGATESTLTTTEEGTYYVIVTNTLANHSDNSVKSADATLGYRVMNDATLSALTASAGTLDPTFAKDVLEYRVDLPEGTVDVPTLSATATMDGYATVTISNAVEFVSYAASSTVTVKSEDATVTNVYTVNFYVKHDLPQVSVSTTTTWNWANAATTMQTIKPATKDVEQLMANIDDEGKQLKNDAEFNSQALIFSGQEALTEENSRWYAKGGHIKFTTTVPGMVTVEFSDNGNNNRKLKINDAISPESSSSKTDVKTFSAIVPAGEVMLEGVNGDGTGNDRYIRISKIIFDANPDPAGADYTRDVTEGRYGTICLPNGGVMVGAEIFEIAYYGETSKKIFLDNIPSGEMVAGRPYIFLPKEGATQLAVFYTDEANASAGSHNGLIGFIGDAADEYFYIPAGAGNYILQNNLYREVLAGGQARILSNRAYIKLSAINPTEPALAPGRRRVAMGVQSEQVATGCENLNVSDKPVKMIIDGQLFIIRGEKMYDAKGQLVK